MGRFSTTQRRRMTNPTRLVAVVLVLGMLAACGTGGSATTSSTSPGKSDATIQPSSTGAAGEPDSGPVAFYSSMTAENIQPVLDEFTAATGIEVELFALGSSEINARLEQEVVAGRITADIVHTSSLAGVHGFHERGWLAEACNGEYDAYVGMGVPKGWVEPCYYAPTNVNYWLPVVNANIVDVSAFPQEVSWSDIFTYAREHDLAVGTGDAENAGGWYNYYWVMRSALGREFFDQYSGLHVEAYTDNTVLANKGGNGELPVLLPLIESVYLVRKKEGAPLQALYPSDGIGGQPNTIAAIEGGPNPNGASRLIEWIMSKAGQEAIARYALARPVRTDVDVLGEGMEDFGDRPLLSYGLDWTLNTSQREEFIADWVRLFR